MQQKVWVQERTVGWSDKRLQSRRPLQWPNNIICPPRIDHTQSRALFPTGAVLWPWTMLTSWFINCLCDRCACALIVIHNAPISVTQSLLSQETSCQLREREIEKWTKWGNCFLKRIWKISTWFKTFAQNQERGCCPPSLKKASNTYGHVSIVWRKIEIMWSITCCTVV